MAASEIRTLVVGGANAEVIVAALGLDGAKTFAATGVAALDLAFQLPAPALVLCAVEPRSPPGNESRLEEGSAGVAFLFLEDGAVRRVETAAPTEAPAFVVGESSRKGLRPAFDARKDWGDLGVASGLVQLAESLRHGLGKGQWCVADGLALASAGNVVVTPPGERARRVNATRALLESRSLAAGEDIPDSPMGAFVPWGTWLEDLPARLRLIAQRCDACGKTMYPPRGACVACRGRSFSDLPLPETAVVYVTTRIGRGGAPSEFALEQSQVGAYWVGVVEWPEHGVRVTARLAGYDEHGPAIGDNVRAIVRRLFEQQGVVRYGTKFGPS